MKIIITGAWQGAFDKLESIKEMGHEVVYMQNEKDDLPCSVSDIEGVICNGLFLYHDIKEFTSLQFIQLTSAGYDRVPLDYIKEKNIKIINAKGVYSIPMAEFALFGVLQLYKQGKFFIKNQECHKWDKHREILELFGKHVCIVGCGSIGTECAKRFNAFGCETVGVDVLVRADENYKEIIHLNKLEDALKNADIVILTLPLTEDTKGLFNESRIKVMKKGAILVNVARGAIVEENALINALENHLFGAVLDVFEEEPLNKNSQLWDMENVILTPHNSFVGEGNENRLWNVILKTIELNSNTKNNK